MGEHWIWLGVVLLAALVIFGPKRLPDIGRALGRGVHEFRAATTELTNASGARDPEARTTDESGSKQTGRPTVTDPELVL